MPMVHLIEGPVGAGKSTFAQDLSVHVQGVHIALDEWFAQLFSRDRPASDVFPWYVQRKDRLLELIWAHSRRLLATNRDVVLELGLIQRQGRGDFCRRVLAEGWDLCIHVLDAPHEVRRERVQRRNREKGPTYFMNVPDHVFDLASQLWEPPDQDECSEFRIESHGFEE